MNPNGIKRATTLVFTLVLISVMAAAAGAMSVTLTGNLTQSDDGAFWLVEESSGGQVALKPANEDVAFEAHLDQSVIVSGEWVESGDAKVFVVSKIELADSSPTNSR